MDRHHKRHSPEKDPVTGEAIIRFGDWLIRRGLISHRQMQSGLRRALKEGCRIGDALVSMAAVERAEVEQEAAAHHAFSAFLRTSHLATVLLGD